MICPNIIIITEAHPKDDDEVQAAVEMLKKRYKDRKIIHLKINPYETQKAFTKIAALQKESGATGVYVIGHGTANLGIHPPLIKAGDVTHLAQLLVKLFEQGFNLRKVCLLVCCGVQQAEKKPVLIDVPSLDPTQIEKEAAMYAQDICRALSKEGNKDRMEGLMVAGYTSGVFLLNPAEVQNTAQQEKLKDRRLGTKTSQEGKPDFMMRPTDLGKKSSLANYAARKIVFVCEKGNWRMGKLSEYTDKAELKSALSGLGQ